MVVVVELATLQGSFDETVHFFQQVCHVVNPGSVLCMGQVIQNLLDQIAECPVELQGVFLQVDYQQVRTVEFGDPRVIHCQQQGLYCPDEVAPHAVSVVRGIVQLRLQGQDIVP